MKMVQASPAMSFCADTMLGTIHRFPASDGPCQCGAVIRNRPHQERTIKVPRKPDGSRTAPVLDLLTHGHMTVEQIALALLESNQWVKHSLRILIRAKKVTRTGERKAIDPRGCRRSVAIYGLRASPVYPESHAARAVSDGC